MWTAREHSDESRRRIVAAFPASLRLDVAGVLDVLAAADREPSPDDIGPVAVGAESVRIPFRLYLPEPDARRLAELTARQRFLVAAIFTRHCDGHVRERSVAALVASDAPWAPPFVLQLLGEYVLEIHRLLESQRDLLRRDVYREFLAANPAFCDLTCQRIVSYWDVYFRGGTPLLADHPACRVARDIGLWRRPPLHCEPVLFAEYRPRHSGDAAHAVLPAPPVVRPMEPGDVPAVARLAQRRDGGDLARHVAGFDRAVRAEHGTTDEILLTATVGSRIAGYAKAAAFVPPPDAPPNCAPAGWYLTGVNVAPGMRRRGIALELTLARLARIAERADCVYYFTNALNRASIDLHARLGFVEVTRDFWYPRTSFTGGVGILFRAQAGNQFRETPSRP